MTVSTRQQEFLTVYQQTLTVYITRYKLLEDPPDPASIFWTRQDQ